MKALSSAAQMLPFINSVNLFILVRISRSLENILACITNCQKAKKNARQLIDKGIGTAYKNALEDLHHVISTWKAGAEGNKNAYMNVYRELQIY